MPVRSSRSNVLTWPPPEAVTGASRGHWGVGSDLDLAVIRAECGEPPLRRGLAFDTISGFPVPVDLLVYTQDEWRRLEAEKAPFVQRLLAEVAWVA
jgi:hypothetical protein